MSFVSIGRLSSEMHPEREREERMAKYVDGYVVPVPKDKIDAYRRLAEEAGKAWREHGELEYVECIA